MYNTALGLDLLFETSWEVCNKIGGIYTVLSTKAKTLQTLYKDKVIFIGPDVWSENNPSPYFVETKSLLKGWKSKAQLPEGVSVRVGRWNVPGKPIVILVKFDGMYACKDAFYGEMWQKFGVDSLHAYGDYDEACAFSHAAGLVIESICKYNDIATGNKRIIAHFDEWTTGMGLLYVKANLPKVATIFTTHATSIGRSICGNGKPLYDYMKGYNGDQMARELNMEAKHSLEKAAAHNADCFTTVSDVTAIECEQLLEKRPDVVTPNGFEQNFVPSKSNFTKKRSEAREQLLKTASALIGGNLDNDSFIVATSGRCEYRNKGIDVFIDAIMRLSQLKAGKKVLAYIMVPAWSKEPRMDLQKAMSSNESKKLNEPILTHWLNNPESDAILQRLHQLCINNDANADINIVYVPCYLNGNDGIFNKTYYDLLIGMDATVFPSYYEPWGYTPLESVAFGVPTITTTLSGFGQWVMSTTNNQFESCGVDVVARNDSNYEMVVDSIARSLKFLTECDECETKKINAAAMSTASRAAWSYFIKYYVNAFEIALEKKLCK
ncbi:MAG: glycosyltransferase [Muribaculaceae bacterium]|nr:glycosyltransferase [Muribaculaceae bacterium]